MSTDPTPAGCRASRRCPIADDPCGPGGPRPYCWETPTPGEDVYRAAARAYANALADPANNGSERGTWLEDQPTLRAAVQSAYAAGREAAAQAVLDWAAAHVAWDDGLTAQLAEIARGGR